MAGARPAPARASARASCARRRARLPAGPHGSTNPHRLGGGGAGYPPAGGGRGAGKSVDGIVEWEMDMADRGGLRDITASASRIVAFPGAGISPEPGIPHFRRPGGIWARYKPIYFDDFMS